MPKKKRLSQKERVPQILAALEKHYPHVRCALHHESPFQLLIATILSAQCTDKKVNEVTPVLFQKFPSPEKMAAASLKEIEKQIKSIGLFRSKAKSLKECSQKLVEEFHGEVPSSIEELLQLRGVARKTANVVLGEIWNRPDGVVVDTHVRRISYLLGLTKETDPKKIEKDLNRLIPREEWVNFTHRVIHLGREICIARRPQCLTCPLLEICPRKGLPRLQNRVFEQTPEQDLRPARKKRSNSAANSA